ncbi:hypothetical protein EDD53_2368, partial [Pacificibacter maritimus]
MCDVVLRLKVGCELGIAGHKAWLCYLVNWQ